MAAIEIPYLNQLPLGYKKAVKSLNRKLAKSNNSSEKFRHLEAFSDKYTAVSEIWDYWLRLYNYGNSERFHISGKQLKTFPIYHLNEWPTYSSDPLISYNNVDKNTAKLHQNTSYAINIFISLPHSKLSKALDYYDEYSPIPLNRGMIVKYKAACELYQKIKNTDCCSDAEKYIELLKEANNEEFVIKNMEIQLYRNPWCQNLWIAFINFLENDKKDGKALLQLLSRYCRLFINDKTMKEKYHSKIEEFSQTSTDEMTEFWIDSIKFEFDFQNLEAGKKLIEKVLNYSFTRVNFKAIDDIIMLYSERYNFSDFLVRAESIKNSFIIDTLPFEMFPPILLDDNTKMQSFPFRKTINHYLYDKISHQHLQKLYQTCKWFYYKYRYNLVHRMTINSDGSTHNEIYKHFYYNSLSIETGYSCKDEFPFKRLWLTHSAEVGRIPPFFKQSIAKNGLKYLSLLGFTTRVHFNDFKFLAKSKLLVKIEIFCKIVYDENDIEVPLEDIFAVILHVRRIACDRCCTSAETSEKLLALKFKNKIEKLYLSLNRSSTPPINVNYFFTFLQNNLAPNANLSFPIRSNNTQPFPRDLQPLIETWTPENEKPIMRN